MPFPAALLSAAPLLLLLLTSVVPVELPGSSPAFSALPCLASLSSKDRRMSRSAGGSAGGKSQSGAAGGGGGDQARRFADVGGAWGGFPMYGPSMFPGFHTLDQLYAEMMDNVERVRSEMERLYYPPFGRMTPYPALAPAAGAPPPPALRAGSTTGAVAPAVPVGTGRGAGGGGSIMPYYRGSSGPFDVMAPFYSPLFAGGAMMPYARGVGAVVPRVDFQDMGDEYLLQADVPGVDKNNVKIQVQNGVLHISGEQQQESKEQQKGYFMQERYQTAFSRSLMLPENVKEDDIRATMKDGVLQVHIPKVATEKSNVKKIHVE